jgi:hypothetical protein
MTFKQTSTEMSCHGVFMRSYADFSVGSREGLYGVPVGGTYICAVLHCINIPRKTFVGEGFRSLHYQAKEGDELCDVFDVWSAKLRTSAEGECIPHAALGACIMP